MLLHISKLLKVHIQSYKTTYCHLHSHMYILVTGRIKTHKVSYTIILNHIQSHIFTYAYMLIYISKLLQIHIQSYKTTYSRL